MLLFYLAWCTLFYQLQSIDHGPVISWSVAYGCSIFWQHLLNRVLVWPDAEQSYWESLGGMCAVYMASLLISAGLNVLFVEVLQVAANFAFFVTAVFTGAVNYVVIAKCLVASDMGAQNDDSNARDDVNYDPVVDLATNMVQGIQLPSIEVSIVGKLRQTAKLWTGAHNG